MRAYAHRWPVEVIAVVGNAPLASSRSRARLIDEADLVIRVNAFALDCGSPAVGRRADVVILNRGIQATPWQFDDYRNRLYLLVEPGRMHWEPPEIPQWWPTDLGLATIPNREVTIPLAHEIGLDAARDGLWATTGTTAAWVARVGFPSAELRLAGFSFIENPHQTSWNHAYGPPSRVEPEHRIGAEAALLRSWREQSLVRILP